MSEEKEIRNKEKEKAIEEITNEVIQGNENFAEDYYQEQEEGTMEDIDSHLDEIGFEDEQQSERLSLRKIKRYNEAIEQREKVEFWVEYEGQKDLVYITIEKNFTKTNIIACLQEYIKKIDVLRAKKIELRDGFLEMYLIFQMIKHFTDLELPKSIENQLIVMERLINTGLIFTIFAEFPKSEIDKVLVEVNSINETLDESFAEMEKQLQNLNPDDLENVYLKDQMKEDVSKVMEQNASKKAEEEIQVDEDTVADDSKE